MYTLIIFDFDRTLINLNADWPKIRLELKTILSDFGFQTEVVRTDKSVTEGLEYIKKKSGEGKAEKLKKKITKMLEQHECKAGDEASEIIRGTQETLEYISSRKIKMAILSGNTTKAITSALKKFQLEKYFDFIIGEDSVQHPKPDPEGIEKIIELLKINKNEVLVIGDSTLDILSAKSAGVKSIGVLTGDTSLRELQDAGADFIIKSLAELQKLI